MREAPKLLRSGSEPDAAAVMQMFENVETLHDAVTNYLSAQLIGERVERDGVAAEQVLEIAHYVRSAAEIVAGNLVELIREAAERSAAPSAETAEVLRELHQRVADLFEEAVHAARDKDGASAQRVIGAKAEIDALIARAQQQLLAGLGAEAPARALLFRLESSAVEHLKRVYYFAKRIAKLVAPLEAGDLRRSARLCDGPPCLESLTNTDEPGLTSRAWLAAERDRERHDDQADEHRRDAEAER